MDLLCFFPVVIWLNFMSTDVYVNRILKSLEWAHIENTSWIWKHKCQEYSITHPDREQKQNPGPAEDNSHREAIIQQTQRSEEYLEV